MIEFEQNHLNPEGPVTILYLDREGQIYRNHIPNESQIVQDQLESHGAVDFLMNNSQWAEIEVLDNLEPTFTKYIVKGTREIIDQSDVYISPNIELQVLSIRRSGHRIYEGLSTDKMPEGYDNVPLEYVWLSIGDDTESYFIKIKFIKFIMLDVIILPYLVSSDLTDLPEVIKNLTAFDQDDWRLFPLWRQIKRIRDEGELDIVDAIKYSQLNYILDDLLTDAEKGIIEWTRDQLGNYLNQKAARN